ncbi:transposable element Tc1 transposase [Trichonephila clavipes]|nr:transposable element Tc1 transposase [Trichonephila clavipes]
MANNQSVRRHLDAFTRGRIIAKLEVLWYWARTRGKASHGPIPIPLGYRGHWEKLEEGRSVTSVAADFGIAHSIVSRLWREFQTTGAAIRGFNSGRQRGTKPADDRYIVLQARRNRWQTAGEIARHTTQATGRPILRFTVARRLHGDGLFARCPKRYGSAVPFLDDNAPCHRTVADEQLLESRRLAARTLPPVTIRELRLALQEEWVAMPQQLIDTLILSISGRCETCLAVRGDHIPY